jgi:hypothetical protein
MRTDSARRNDTKQQSKRPRPHPRISACDLVMREAQRIARERLALVGPPGC